MVDPNQHHRLHPQPPQSIGHFLEAARPALVLPTADDALASSPQPFSPIEADAIAAQYLSPRPPGSPQVFTATYADIEDLCLAPPAPPPQPTPALSPHHIRDSGAGPSTAHSVTQSPTGDAAAAPPVPPDIFSAAFAHNSGAGPSRAGSAAQSPAGGSEAAPPAPAPPSILLSQAAADLPLPFDFPDPSAAIAAAARLPAKSAQPDVVTLTSGLDASVRHSTFLDSAPEVKLFVNSVCQVSQFVPPEKLMTFLDGGDGRKGILTAFRRKRTEALLAKRPGRSGSSVSGSAYEDARYFERQIFIPLTENALSDVVITNWAAIFPYLSERQQQIIRECHDIMGAGGVRELMRRNERMAEDAGAESHANKLAAKQKELLADNDGRPFSTTELKKVRDAASGARSNEVRKKIFDLARADAKCMLDKRWELHSAYEQTLHAWPDSQEFGLNVLRLPVKKTWS